MIRPTIPDDVIEDEYESPRDKIAKLVDKMALAKITSHGGRPTIYRKEYDEIVEMLHLVGSNLMATCAILNITPESYKVWCYQYPSFGASVMKGREIADAQVGKSLFQRATGYSHQATHISIIDGQVVQTKYTKHYPPDTAAAIYWLNNRMRAKWRTQHIMEHFLGDDKTDPTQSPAITINVVPNKKTK